MARAMENRQRIQNAPAHLRDFIDASLQRNREAQVKKGFVPPANNKEEKTATTSLVLQRKEEPLLGYKRMRVESAAMKEDSSKRRVLSRPPQQRLTAKIHDAKDSIALNEARIRDIERRIMSHK